MEENNIEKFMEHCKLNFTEKWGPDLEKATRFLHSVKLEVWNAIDKKKYWSPHQRAHVFIHELRLSLHEHWHNSVVKQFTAISAAAKTAKTTKSKR